MKEPILFERYDSIKDLYEELGIEVPSYIIENLKYDLRHYQEDAIKNFIYWDTKDKKRLEENHILFQMATGTGKTLLMASLIIYLYEKGYRKFIFFVNSKTILEKTKQNFINSINNKYLFKEKIEIKGKKVEIKAIDNLEDSDQENINILFTTIQGLHTTLNKEKENAPTYSDFKKHKVVFLADEAHHNNTQSKQLQIELEASWEKTIKESFSQNKENYLIELTATAELEKLDIREKYRDKLIFNYNLKSFRKDGYSKDIRVIGTQLDKEERMLLAIIVSEYRRHIAGKNRLQIKPVILFKSSKIAESEENFNLLCKIVETLDESKLNEIVTDLQKETENSFLKEIKIFVENNKGYLLNNIPIQFQKDKLINVNNDSENEKNQILLNSLEDIENKKRVIFAVNKLNEGWDVLNLYDIVKLYETKNPKNTATSEIQLIGRGARYYPFIIEDSGIDEDMKYKRKYDKGINADSNLNILEQLHYHSLREVEFINELNRQIEEVGLSEGVMKEVKVSLKEDFINTRFYKEGLVFTNSKVKKESKFRSIKKDLQIDIYNEDLYVDIPKENEVIDLNKIIKEHDIEDTKELDRTEIIKNRDISLKEIDDRIFYKAISKYNFYSFYNISKYIDNIKSIKDLKEIFGDSYIKVYYKEGMKIKDEYIFVGLCRLLEKLKDKMDVHKQKYQGTRKFNPQNISSVFKNIKINVSKEINNNKSIEDTVKINYFVQDSFYGDSSYEKQVIEDLNIYFNEDSNRKLYKDVYMIRNYRNVRLYNFSDGMGFEPDFILFLKKEYKDITYQLFIEPKGEHIKEGDKWKEKFMLEICQVDDPNRIELTGGYNYKILGVPFYDIDRRNDFNICFKDKLVRS